MTHLAMFPNQASNRLFDDVLSVVGGLAAPSSQRSRHQNGSYFAPCDIVESADRFQLTFDVVGVPLENIQIEAKANQLTVSGERKKSELGEKESLYRSERRFGKFNRTFSLPEDCDLEGISANYNNGELVITLPKTEARKPRQIAISPAP